MLEDKLNQDEQRSLKSLVHKWLQHANRGSAKHLELILERIDPVVNDAAHEAKIVLQGIRLEMGSGAPNAPREPGFVVQGAQESRVVAPDADNPQESPLA